MNNSPDAISNQCHRTAKGFRNEQPFKIKLRDIWRWHRQRKVLPPKMGYDAFRQTWCENIDLTLIGDRVWWIGHSTTLIRLNNKIILTDPIFSQRASPSQWMGPKRLTPAAISIDKLSQLDFIVISHNHYDHLDFTSIKQLIMRFANVTLLVPLGLKNKLIKWGAQNVIELDWWDSININDITFTATPAQHWSKRGLFDTNKVLWCGWMMQSNCDGLTKTVYFMGDTGYSPSLKKINERFSKIDLALIPIGAYAPRWFMQSQHIDPAQAVQLYDELNCQSAIAIHWGTFELADDPLDEPPELLSSLKHSRQFYLLKIGGSLAINPENYELK